MSRSHRPRFLVVLLGHVMQPMLTRFGDYDVLYSRGLRAGVPQCDCDCDCFNLIDDPQAKQPRVDEYDGLVFSGGPSMVSHGGAWLDTAVAMVHEAQRQNTAVLGVCLGHQMVAHSAGAVVGPVRVGKNLGTRQVHLLDAARQDALLSHLPATFVANVSHSEGVLEMSPAITPLARTDYDPCHALRVGKATWGIQFHPEFDHAFMSDYLSVDRMRAAMPAAKWQAECAGLQPTPLASAVMGQFARLCAAR